MKKILGLFIILCLVQSVNAVTNYFPLKWDFESDYLQGSVYGQGATYELGDVCNAKVDLTFSNIGGTCAIGGGIGTQYGFSGTLKTECVGGAAGDKQNILNYNGGMAYPFITTSHTNLLNESFVVRPDLVTGATHYGQSNVLSCEDGNKTCTLTFSSVLDGQANYICYNDSITDTIWAANDYQLALFVDGYDGFTVNDDHDSHNLFDGVSNISNAFIVYTASLSVGTHNYIVNGTDYDYNYSSLQAAQEDKVDKTLIVNITGYPSTINMSDGEVGLWDCDSVGKTEFYFFDSLAPTAETYQNIKDNCCNLLESMTECVHVATTDSSGVDNYGDLSLTVDFDTESLKLDPEYVYFYSDSSYPDKYVYGNIDLGWLNNPHTVTMQWSGDTGIQQYYSCWHFFDSVNESVISVESSWWTYSSDEGVSYPNSWSEWAINGESLYLQSGSPGYYKVYFTKDGYSNSEIYQDQLKTVEECDNVILERNGTLGVDASYNGTIFGRRLGYTGKLIGVDLTVKCDRSPRVYTGKTTSAGFRVENILDKGWCYVTYNMDGCTGDDTSFYVNGANRDMNFTMFCSKTPGGDDGGNTTTGYMNMKFFVHKEGSSAGLPSITLSVSGDYTGNFITHSDGFGYVYNVPATGRYTISTSTGGYAPFKSGFDGKSPMDISLIPLESFNQFFIKTLSNGSVQGNVTLTFKLDGVTVKTTKSSDKTDTYGLTEFVCSTGKTYTVEAAYLGKTASIDVECLDGEGKTYSLDVTGGSQSRLDGTGDSIADFGAYMWFFVEILLLMFAVLVFKRIGNEILH